MSEASGGLEHAAYAGTSHLLATKALVRYNDYVYKLIGRRLNQAGQLLEFGPGLGDFVERFHKDGVPIDAVELETEFHPYLGPFCRRVVRRLDELPGLFDGIVAINVLEHIEDDSAILRSFHAKLKPGGLASLYHPAGSALYSHMDKLVVHYRRYDKADLEAKVRAAGFEVEESVYVDSVGYLVYGLYKLLKWGDGNISTRSMWFYDNFVFPISLILDPLVGRSFGRSLFVLARKK